MAWALTDQGRLAYDLAQRGDLEQLCLGDGRGWHRAEREDGWWVFPTRTRTRPRPRLITPHGDRVPHAYEDETPLTMTQSAFSAILEILVEEMR